MVTRLNSLSFLILTALAGSSIPVNAATFSYNITTPDANGISISNNLISFDLTEEDALILNNYTGDGQVTSKYDSSYSVGRNGNLNNTAASVIVLESQGARSQIRGVTEIVGNTADLVMVNASGIVCNGCGFINTNNITLSSGFVSLAPGSSTLQFDTRMARGDITIGELGLVLNEHDQTPKNVNLISRTVNINGAMSTNNLTAIANNGVVRLDEMNNITPTDSNESAHIDISRIANINATGKIHLVVNAMGAGVNRSYLNNNGNITTSLTEGEAINLNANNLTLTNNGKLIAGNTTQRSDILVNAARIINDKTAEIVGQNISMTSSQDLINRSQINGSGTVSVNVTSLDNSGDATINAGALAITSVGNVMNAGTITATNNMNITTENDINNSGILDVNQGNLNLSSTNLNNSLTASRLLAKEARVNIRKDINNRGNITLSGASSFNYKTFNHEQGRIQLNNSIGQIAFSGNRFNSSADINLNGAGVVEFNRNVFTNRGILTVGNNSVANFKQGEFNNQVDASVINSGTLSLDKVNFNNSGAVTNTNTFNFSKGKFENRLNANISGDNGNITFTDSAAFENSGTIRANTININARNLLVKNNNIINTIGSFNSNIQSFYNGGNVSSGALSITSNNGNIQNNSSATLSSRGATSFSFINQTFNNRGTITGSRGSTLTLTGDSFQNNGVLNGDSNLNANVAQFVNTNTGKINNQQGDINFNVRSVFNNNGTINGRNITVSNNNVDFNNDNKITATGLFSASVRDFNNENLTAANVIISASRNFNQYGLLELLSHKVNSNITVKNLNNNGRINSSGELLNAKVSNRLTNSGSITARNLNITAESIVNNGSILVSKLLAKAAAISNRLTGTISSSGSLELNTLAGADRRIINDGTITTTGRNNLVLAATQLINTGTINASDRLMVTTSGNITNSGNLKSRAALSLTAKDINNSGNISTQANTITLSATNRLDNKGEIKSATADDRARGDITLTAKTISFGNKIVGRRVLFNAADQLTTLQGSILEAGYLKLMAKTQLVNYATTISRTLEVMVSNGNLINRGWLYGKDSANLSVKNGNIYNAYRIKGVRTDILAKCLFNYDINGLGSGRIYTDRLLITQS